MTPPWERQPNEGARSFEAFAYYRDLGPQRSLKRVREKLGGKPGKARQLEAWSSRHQWVRRALAWDDEQDRLARQSAQDARDAMRRRHLESALLFQRALAAPAHALLERLDQGDPATIEALRVLPAEELVKLVALAARANKAPVAWELVASGEHAAGLEGDSAGEDALAQLAEALEAVAKERPTGVRARRKT